MMKGFLFCCFCVSVMKSKNLHVPPTPVMFCLQKGLSRDSFIYCLKSFSNRLAPWIIDITNLFRSTAKCYSLLSCSFAIFWTKLVWNKSVWVDLSIWDIFIYKRTHGQLHPFCSAQWSRKFSWCARMHLLLLQELWISLLSVEVKIGIFF